MQDPSDAIVLNWTGVGDDGLFAAGLYQELGPTGPEYTEDVGIIEIDRETGDRLAEWALGPYDAVLGLAGQRLVVANLAPDAPRVALLPLHADRPKPVAVFDDTDQCTFSATHGLLSGGYMVLPCSDTSPPTSGLVLQVAGDDLQLLGRLEDGCWLSTVEGEELWCLSGDARLRRYALPDLALLGEITGLPAMDLTRQVRSNLPRPASSQIGLVPPPIDNPSDTYEVYAVPASGAATRIGGTSPSANLGWCQDAWWTGTGTLVTCQEGSALVSGEPLAVHAEVAWPTAASVVAPLGDGRIAVAATGVALLDPDLQVVGGYHRQWRKNALTGDYHLDEGTWGP